MVAQRLATISTSTVHTFDTTIFLHTVDVIKWHWMQVECPAVTPEVVLKASGHVDRFTDLMVKDKITGDCYRADHLLEKALDTILDDPKQKPTEQQRKVSSSWKLDYFQTLWNILHPAFHRLVWTYQDIIASNAIPDVAYSPLLWRRVWTKFSRIAHGIQAGRLWKTQLLPRATNWLRFFSVQLLWYLNRVWCSNNGNSNWENICMADFRCENGILYTRVLQLIWSSVMLLMITLLHCRRLRMSRLD